MPTLRDLSVIEAEAFVSTSVETFVGELVASGVDRARATRATDDHMRRVLPDGVRTAGHQFRSVDDEGRRVGRLWFGPMPDSPGDWFLFEISLEEESRGGGIGRSAMEQVIDELERLEAGRLGLHVFDANTAAIARYESLGFQAGDRGAVGREMWLPIGTP
ncbi:MAG: GNAT family N-acetyltransferase [Actinomycetota bacterium]